MPKLTVFLSFFLLVPPNITALSPSVTVIEGNGAILSCTVVSGKPFPTITWYYNDTAISRSETGYYSREREREGREKKRKRKRRERERGEEREEVREERKRK